MHEMSQNNVCRLCLSMDAPMHIIADSPLQGVYEKLTNVPLNTQHWPMAACCFCHSQLWKSHNLMVRSVRANRVLRQILDSDILVNKESIATINYKAYQIHDALAATPVEILSIAGAEHDLVKTDIEEEPSQHIEEMEARRQIIVEYFKLEKSDEDMDEVAVEDTSDMETQEFIAEGEISYEELEQSLNISNEGSEGVIPPKKYKPTHAGNISETVTLEEKNVPQELKTRRVTEENGPRRSIGTYKLRSTKKAANNTQLTSTSNVETVTQKRANDTRTILTPGEDSILQKRTKNIRIAKTPREDNVSEKLASNIGTAVTLDEGTVPQKHADNAITSLKVDEKIISQKPRSRRTVTKEDALKCTHMSESSEKVESNAQASLHNSTYSNTKINKGSVYVACDNDCTSVNADVDGTSSVFDDKSLQIEHHNVAKKKIRLKRGENVSHRGTLKFNTKRTHSKSPTGQTFKCNICQRKFTKKSSLKTHLIMHTGKKSREKSFKCKICQLTFNSEISLNRHLTKHSGDIQFKCKVCHCSFAWKDSLKAQLKKSTDKPFACEVCQENFAWRTTSSSCENDKGNVKTSTNKNYLACLLCQYKASCKKSYSVHNFIRHLRTHAGVKLYECTICKRKFTTNFGLTLHLKLMHTERKLFECKICKVKLKHKNSLQIHLRKHTGEFFECDICQQRILTKAHLVRHLLIHTGDKRFACDVCGARFYQKYHLDGHFRTHTEVKPFECDICKSRFKGRSNLKSHLASHSEEQFECDICKVRYKTKSSLKRHREQHNKKNVIKRYHCTVCDRRFKFKIWLENHVRIHTGEKPFQCETCQLRFSQKASLNRHLRIHTGVKPYKCDVCQRSFAQKEGLIAHLRTHTDKADFIC